MAEHWFVVASQTTVRIFRKISDRKRIQQIRTFENPLGRLRNGDYFRKQPGMGIRSFGRVGVARYTESKRHDPHEEAAIQFAKEIAKTLEIERQKKNFSSLTVLAEPRFLGKLRSAMGNELKKQVVEWIHKDLQRAPQDHLSDILVPKVETAEAEAL